MALQLRMRSACVTSLLALACGAAGAAPYIPGDDQQVLERLPEQVTVQAGELQRLRAQAAAAPDDATKATVLADAYYRIARSEGDPRYLGYAQAVLAPWWMSASAPAAVLVTRAVIRQSNHAFDAARADLDTVLAREPRNPRALLVRATILTVQGKYAAARQDCPRLFGVAPEIYVFDCQAAIDSLTGNARGAVSMLERALADRNVAAAERGWSQSLLGEIRDRLDDPAAEAAFRAALVTDPRDLYTLGAYADWLLDHGRAADVVPLVRGEPRVDALLLRLAIAQQGLRTADAAATIAALRARFAASRARGDTVHRREEARFELAIAGNATIALELAMQNWRVQREPADLRILAETAAAARNEAALATVRAWLAETRLEYPRVARLVAVDGAGR
jgi:uncharacterized protein (TIGR02996 family)